MQVYSNTTLVKVKWEYSGEPYHFRINNSNTTLVKLKSGEILGVDK